MRNRLAGASQTCSRECVRALRAECGLLCMFLRLAWGLPAEGRGRSTTPILIAANAQLPRAPRYTRTITSTGTNLNRKIRAQREAGRRKNIKGRVMLDVVTGHRVAELRHGILEQGCWGYPVNSTPLTLAIDQKPQVLFSEHHIPAGLYAHFPAEKV